MKVKILNTLLLGMILTSLMVFMGCSKDKDEATPDMRAGKVNATITVSDEFVKADGYSFTVLASGATSISGGFTDWLVNGEKRTGTMIELGTDDFAGGKTITLESTKGVISGLISIQGQAGAVPYTVSYKIEKGDEVRGEGTNEKIQQGQDPIFMKSADLSN